MGFLDKDNNHVDFDQVNRERVLHVPAGGLVTQRASIASTAVSFFIVKLYVWFRPSRGCGGFASPLF